MPNLKIGTYIKVLKMKDEPDNKGKIAKVVLIDDANQIHGTWGGCALIPEVDSFIALPEVRTPLFEMCEKSDTSLSGMNYLVDYYVDSLGWSEKEAVNYAIGLFHNGTIREIKLFGKDGKQL